jgi:hypothetical protein
MNKYLLNILQLFGLTAACWALNELIIKICYWLYPIGLKLGGSAPSEIYNFGVPPNIERMLFYTLVFFFITILEKKYQFTRIISKIYSAVLLLLISYSLVIHIKEMVELSLSQQ